MKLHLISSALIIALLAPATAAAESVPDAGGLDYSVSVNAWHGSGDFAPHLIASGCFGMADMSSGATLSAMLSRKTDMSRRFSFGVGVQLASGWQGSVGYAQFDDGVWRENSNHPSRFWIQQLYGEVKWRSLSATFGMKNRGSALFDDVLSSGDLVHSNNARPTPELMIELNRFVDIPLTSGWVQIGAALAYGRFTDDGWWRQQFNYYSGHIASGQWYTYRRLHFRTRADRRVFVTVGVQSAGQFGGTTYYYEYGSMGKEDRRGLHLKDFFKIQFGSGGETFVFGNTLGAWDLKATVNLAKGRTLEAYTQMPWEDGSGMAKLNGFDGLYGIAYHDPDGFVTGAAVEYLDLTNQSGPIHWAPGDYPGTTIPSEATGADNYYNNAAYNAYALYGRTIGSSMVMGPLYNLNGVNEMVGNRMRGVHAAVTGRAPHGIGWRASFSWSKAYGNGFKSLVPALHSVSVMAEASWKPARLPHLRFNLQGAVDRGTMPSNSAALLVGMTYSGEIGL